MPCLISIVVPVFNAGPALERCLLSLQKQTDSNFEVVLVDDGSSDDCLSSAHHFIESDARIRLFSKSNGGVSSARNLALTFVRGDVVLFVDADDTVEPDFIAVMRTAIEGKDLVVCAYDSVRPTGSESFVLSSSTIVNMDAVYEHSFCTQIINGGCCNKAFRLDLIRQHGLRFNESFSVGEDMVFLAEYFQHCERVAYVNRVLYHYTVNAQSLTQSAISQGRVTARDASVLSAMDALVLALKDQSPLVRGYGDFRRVRSSLRLLFQMVLAGTQEPKWLAHIAHHSRAGLVAFWLSSHSRWLERLTVLAIAVAPSVVFTMALAFARRRPGWLAGLRA